METSCNIFCLHTIFIFNKTIAIQLHSRKIENILQIKFIPSAKGRPFPLDLLQQYTMMCFERHFQRI